MNINSLQNSDQISGKRNDRIKEARNAQASATVGAADSDLLEDKISISKTPSSDYNFAMGVYKKLDDTTLDRIRAIRGKIDNGDYTSDASIKKLAASIEKDIYQLDSDSFSVHYEPTYPVDIAKLKEQLFQNPDIYIAVSERLSQILSKI